MQSAWGFFSMDAFSIPGDGTLSSSNLSTSVLALPLPSSYSIVLVSSDEKLTTDFFLPLVPGCAKDDFLTLSSFKYQNNWPLPLINLNLPLALPPHWKMLHQTSLHFIWGRIFSFTIFLKVVSCSSNAIKLIIFWFMFPLIRKVIHTDNYWQWNRQKVSRHYDDLHCSRLISHCNNCDSKLSFFSASFYFQPSN